MCPKERPAKRPPRDNRVEEPLYRAITTPF